MQMFAQMKQAKIMGKEMQGFDEGTIGPGLTTDSESLQEIGQVDNQPEDKGTAVDTAILKRSVDVNTYISSQETSRHDHPQYWVDTKKISDSQPSNEAESLPNRSKQAFLYGQVSTRLQFLHVSKEVGTNVKTKLSYFYSTTLQRSQKLRQVEGGALSPVIYRTFETFETETSTSSGRGTTPATLIIAQ